MGGLFRWEVLFKLTAAPEPPLLENCQPLGPYLRLHMERFGATRCTVDSSLPMEKARQPYGTGWNMVVRVTAGGTADGRCLAFSQTLSGV
jgi:L-fuconolactonase